MNPTTTAATIAARLMRRVSDRLLRCADRWDPHAPAAAEPARFPPDSGQIAPDPHSRQDAEPADRTQELPSPRAFSSARHSASALNGNGNGKYDAEAQAKLAALQSRYEAAAQASGRVLYDWDIQSNRVWFRGATEKVLGYTEEQISGDLSNYLDLIQIEDRTEIDAELVRRLNSKEPYHLEYNIRRSDGKLAILEDHGRFLLNADNEIVGMVGFIADVTDVRQAQAELESSRRLYRAVVEDQTEMICRFRGDGVLTFVNEAYCRNYGATCDELIGRNVLSMAPELIRGEVMAHLKTLGPDQLTAVAEYPVETASGEERWLQWTDRIILDAHGELVEFQSIGRDVTDLKRVEREISRSHELLESIHQVQSRFIADRGDRRIFDLLLSVLLDLTKSEYGFISEVVYDEKETPRLALSAVSETMFASLGPKVQKDLIEGQVVIADLRNLIGAVAVTKEAVVSNSPDRDPRRGHLPPWHPPLRSFLGLPLMEGERFLGILGLANSPNGYDFGLAEFLQPYLATCSGIIEGYRIELERRRIAADLKISKELADAANQAKTAFLVNMSHEIRTPLTAIIGYAELLIDPTAKLVDRDDALRAIKSNGEHLLRIINDILDLTKIESGKLELEVLPCRPWRILREAASGLRLQAESKGLEMRIRAEGPLPRMIQTDATRLRQILVNLIGNAVKFTSKGRIEVAMRLMHDELGDAGGSENGARAWVEFSVEDTGHGIPSHHREKLFQPFQQGDVSTTRLHGGTGLGLNISRKLAQALGGELTLNSKEGVGSRFALALPIEASEAMNLESSELAESQQDAPSAPVPKRLQGRVLLVEDGPDNRVVLSFLLQNAGLALEIAVNGRIALEMVEKAIEPFDLILMDIQMPEMDGYESTRRIRALGVQTPIIALTANALLSDKARCLQAGCDDYLSKPIDRVQLLRALARHLAVKEERNARGAS